MPPRARPEVLGITPYVGGESGVGGGGRNRAAKLSSNEGAFGVPPGAAAALARAAREMHRYPDGGSAALRDAIGARWGLDPARIVCGAGSDELISLLCHSYGPGSAEDGSELLMSAHGFSMYDISGRSHGWRVVKAPERELRTDVDAMLRLVSPQTRMACVAVPNNPTGYLLPRAELERLRAGLPAEVLLVIDAAYAEYVDRPDYEAGAALVDAGDNTVMLRTFSKVFGLGGVRLGWCYGPPNVIDVLNRARNPFNVTLAAQEAGVAALAEPGWVERSRAHNTAERARLAAALDAAGFRVWPSEGNFLLVDFGTAARAAAADAHLRDQGIIVRAMNSYDLPHTLRVTVGTTEECDNVAAALRGFAERAPADA